MAVEMKNEQLAFGDSQNVRSAIADAHIRV
jgi:hypothetical protein